MFAMDLKRDTLYSEHGCTQSQDLVVVFGEKRLFVHRVCLDVYTFWFCRFFLKLHWDGDVLVWRAPNKLAMVPIPTRGVQDAELAQLLSTSPIT